MIDHQEEKVRQTLADAGCSQQQTEEYLSCCRCHGAASGRKVLEGHRKALLRQIHEKERQIDCLDYLTWQMDQEDERK